MVLGQAMKNWMVTEEECGVHRCYLFYVKGAFRVCMILEGEGKGYPSQYSCLENGLQSMGSQRVRHNLVTNTCTCVCMCVCVCGQQSLAWGLWDGAHNWLRCALMGPEY